MPESPLRQALAAILALAPLLAGTLAPFCAAPSGAEPGQAPPAGRQPPASGEWAITTAETFSSRTFQLNGNLTVRAGGSLTLTSVKLSLSPGYEGELHIEVQSGGALVLEDRDHNPASPDDATVVSSSTAYQYLFWVRPGASLVIESSVVRNCGHSPGARGETAGPYLQSSDCRISNSTFTDNFHGLAVDGCSPMIDNSTLYQNRRHGMYVRDADMTLEDNLFDTNAAHGLQLDSSMATLRRNIFRGNLQDGLNAFKTPLRLESNIFQLNKRRGVHADGAPVVSVRDELLQNLVGYYVNGTSLRCEAPNLQYNGYCFYLQDVRANVSNATMLGTYIVQLHLARHSDHTEFDSYNNNIRNVTFGDPQSVLRVQWVVRSRVVWESTGGPVAAALVKFFRSSTGELAFTFTANATGELPPLLMTEYEQTQAGKLNTSSYRVGVFSGRFVESVRTSIVSDLDLELVLDDVPPAFTLFSPRDNITIAMSYINVTGTMLTDLDASLKVNGENVTIDPFTGNFSTRVSLAEGPNIVNVTAVDPIFNLFSVERRVNRDSTPPDLWVDIPPEGLLVNRTYFLLRGTTEPRAYALVNGIPALVLDDGSFEYMLELSEGENPVTVFSADMHKNSAWVNRTVVSDTIPPAVAVVSPEEGAWTNRPLLTLSGKVEPGAGVWVGGQPVDVVAGNFSARTNLTEGQNLLVVEACDRAGNRNSTSVLVRLDTVAPAAVIAFPPDGLTVNLPTVNITGTTEPSAVVSCGRGHVSQDGRGNFSVVCELRPGQNDITVEVRDLAGNVGKAVLSVTLDTFVSFRLASPENGTRTTAASVRLKGLCEPGALLSIDGQNVIADQNGTFELSVPLEMGTNILVINVTDVAGNRAGFLVLVRREAQAGTDLAVAAVLALLVAAPLAAVAAWFLWSRRARAAAAAAPAPPPGPPLLDNQRLVIKPPEPPRERLRCAECLQPVEESWAVCHTCGGPTFLARIASRTRERLEALEPADERGRRLRAGLLKGFSDCDLLASEGARLEDNMRTLSIASQLLLSGIKLDTAEGLASELEREVGSRAAGLQAAREADLRKAKEEAGERMAALLGDAERALEAAREAGEDTRELEKAIGLARLHLRGGNLEKAHKHTLDAKAIADGLPGRGS
ncbi:MAG: hypothetical protein FJ149_06130 [Euryarchaeota archaeon]|nr:hypothetical protein [Euryarchaeota archaeon]